MNSAAMNISSLRIRLIVSVVSLDGIEQFSCVIPHAVFKDDFDVFDVGDARGRIASHDHEIRMFPDRDRPDFVGAAKEDRAVESSDTDCFEGCETGIDEQFDLTLIAEARNVAANAYRIGSGKEKAAGCDKGALEVHLPSGSEQRSIPAPPGDGRDRFRQ